MKGFGKVGPNGNRIAWNGWSHLIVLLLAFFAGVVAGFFLAYLGETDSELYIYLGDHFSIAAQGNLNISFLSVLWDCFRWPVAVLVFSFSAIGVIIIPGLLFVRGFLLSYAVSCFAVFHQHDGVAVGAVLFAITIIFVIPVTFLFAYEGLRSACFRLPGAVASTNGDRFHLETLVIGIGILAVAVAIQWAIIPKLFSSVCARLF